MDKELRKEIIKARIHILIARGTSSMAIVAKLKRQLRALEA